MSAKDRLLTLSNAITDTQMSINKILQYGVPGYREELEVQLAKIMALLSIMESKSDVSLANVCKKSNEFIHCSIEELNCHISVSRQTPEQVRRTFQVIECNSKI